MIELTSRALEKVREIMQDQGIAEGGLRVGVKGGGCSGMSYSGVKVFVDFKSLLFLDGSTLDYKDEGLMQRGFTFLNPKSSGSCGCGESFAV
jgi:iron-sulfur cluster assembly protein